MIVVDSSALIAISNVPPLSRVAVVSSLSRGPAGKAAFRDLEIADLGTVRALLDN